MSEWSITLPRDWAQEPEHQPVAEFRFTEYDEPDEEGFVGEFDMSVQVDDGRFLHKVFRLRPEQFRFFVEEISSRYHAGGPT